MTHSETEEAAEAVCPNCAGTVTAADHYCESCGAALSAEALHADTPRPPDAVDCPYCGGPGEEVIEDYCGRCGRRWSPLREHVELVDGPVAGVTDRGTTHWRNEDAVGLAAVEGEPGGFVLVVCDGVSSSHDPHLVAQAAVEAAVPVLAEAVGSRDADLEAAMVAATAGAQEAAAAVPYDGEAQVGPGACTFVAAAVRGDEAVFGSVGDSRAYWVDGDGATQVGRDDSLVADLVASGQATETEAMQLTGAHAITKWLGRDAVDAEPQITRRALEGPGLVLLVSDGLWNYAPDPAALAELVGKIGSEEPLALVTRLAAFAEEAGGADNITVAVGPYGGEMRGQEQP